MSNMKHSMRKPLAFGMVLALIIIGSLSIAFSRPAVMDGVLAANMTTPYVPQASQFTGVDETADHFLVHYNQGMGADIDYNVTVSKDTQRVDSMTVQYNKNAAGQSVALSEQQVRTQIAHMAPAAEIESIELASDARGSFYNVTYRNNDTQVNAQLSAENGNVMTKTIHYNK